MAHRRGGTAAIRTLAAAPDLDAAVTQLQAYGLDVVAGASVARAQRAVAEATLWNLRVLAGWLPGEGMQWLRLLAGWFEIANVDEWVRTRSGGAADDPFRLGTLATAWPALSAAATTAQLRTALARSPWGDPGGDDPRTVALGMRVAWAARVAAQVPHTREWGSGAVALLLARELFTPTGERRAAAAAVAEPTRRLSALLVGAAAPHEATLTAFGAALAPEARWALRGITDPTALWSAELGWWRRLRADATALLRRSDFGPQAVIGAVALLAADAWGLRAALPIAARGGAGREVLDAVA